MNDINTALLALRVQLMEELLCQKTDFRTSYLDALNILSELIKTNNEVQSEEVFSAIQDLMNRINLRPTID